MVRTQSDKYTVDGRGDYERDWCELLKREKVIAVIRTKDIKEGIALGNAAAAGGIKLIEITWNSCQPAEIIGHLRSSLPHCPIGTGTILTPDELAAAIETGVQFCFTPYVNKTLIETAINNRLPMIPGALTPTEIVTAWQMGASCVKVFPVGALGGVDYIKSLQGPLGDMPLIPTGGVTLDNARDFIEKGAIAVGLSGDLFPRDLVKDKAWGKITERVRRLKKSLGN
ncbi:MAG: 2-dehydro-3-deoxy-phosphogluconate aldolase [Chroococcopsis gigantea SAG 12.99]|jgi:2-dehydro-3-deoxyphosphogluconate aldolase/(4S)-4-hydroxy-2-oxoglutarate aldolase|nr:bifunctional 4-hydroxy-2-oxoglutarate aldolase/2-dehydro-3-deoxy-phosphogluconate aldolase [Chlorogloea purpurea SAG 13.99]MDV3000476.1 2-dehydro-3-deoxy-phosphogluconate aldolase [Chroococcopsis gigantea SAG 12.99]